MVEVCSKIVFFLCLALRTPFLAAPQTFNLIYVVQEIEDQKKNPEAAIDVRMFEIKVRNISVKIS